MNNLVKKILKIIGLYLGYLVLTIIIFYITGIYVWNMQPTKMVLIRIFVFPIFLTLATIVFISITQKIKE